MKIPRASFPNRRSQSHDKARNSRNVQHLARYRLVVAPKTKRSRILDNRRETGGKFAKSVRATPKRNAARNGPQRWPMPAVCIHASAVAAALSNFPRCNPGCTRPSGRRGRWWRSSVLSLQFCTFKTVQLLDTRRS